MTLAWLGEKIVKLGRGVHCINVYGREMRINGPSWRIDLQLIGVKTSEIWLLENL